MEPPTYHRSNNDSPESELLRSRGSRDLLRSGRKVHLLQLVRRLPLLSPGPFAPVSADAVPWTAFRRRLLSFVGQRIAEPADVEDVVQSVLARAARELEAGRQHGDLVAWLFEMTRNAVTDHYRQRARRDRHRDALAAFVSTDENAASPENGDAPQLRGFAGCVRPLIAALPEPYRTTVLRVDLEGTSQVALAKELGLSPSGAKSRVQRGRAMLRGAFLRCCLVERNSAGFTTNVEPGPEGGRCSAAPGGCGAELPTQDTTSETAERRPHGPAT